MKNYRKADEVALNNVNYFQGLLKDAQGEINKMKGDLGRAGFEVELKKEGRPEERTHLYNCGTVIPVPAGILLSENIKEVTICKIRKKESSEVVAQAKAEIAEGDIDIEVLGKYLALARASRMILGDYIETFAQN